MAGPDQCLYRTHIETSRISSQQGAELIVHLDAQNRICALSRDANGRTTDVCADVDQPSHWQMTTENREKAVVKAVLHIGFGIGVASAKLDPERVCNASRTDRPKLPDYNRRQEVGKRRSVCHLKLPIAMTGYPRFFSRHSPDDSRTGVNIHAFPPL